MLSVAVAIVLFLQVLAVGNAAEKNPATLVGGEPIVVLQRPNVSDKSEPQFVSATVLPGRGMAVLQIKAYVPGKGEIDLLNSPPLPEAARLLDMEDDPFGNQVFEMGGAILLPFANRIRGKVSADGKTITATVDGKAVTLLANWSGNEPGAEKHAIHGLMRKSQFHDIKVRNAADYSKVSAVLHAGSFDGHWLSDTDVRVGVTLDHDEFEMTVTATNVGKKPLPMGIGWHPYFVVPSGDRQQTRLHIPSQTRAVMNNYDDTFTTGQLVSAVGTPYDFSSPDGSPLGNQYLDDNFSKLDYNNKEQTISELIDPKAKYGLRLVTLSQQIRSIQVYAPPTKNFVAIEPQFNLPDPYNKDWGNTDTGMVVLKPGESVSWRVRLELFTPKPEAPSQR